MPTRISPRTVGDIMSRQVVCSSINSSLKDVCTIMHENDVSCVVATNTGVPVGILTQTDIIKAISSDKDLKKTKVREQMGSPLVFIRPEIHIDWASQVMKRLNIKRLPIMTDGKLVGIITDHDIMRVFPEMVQMAPAEPFVMRRVFLIREDGKVLYHSIKKGEKDIDEDLIGGMLTAIEHFIKHLLIEVEEKRFDSFNYGNLRIILRKGRRIYLAIFTTGEETDQFCDMMEDVVETIERQFEEYISRWDGDSDKAKGFQEAVSKLIQV